MTDPLQLSRKSAALTDPQRDLLWTIAQMKYGWAHCSNVGGRVRGLQVARSLERMGLVTVQSGTYPTCSPTPEGKKVIEENWPISPFVLGTYDHQPDGWTPREGVGHVETKKVWRCRHCGSTNVQVAIYWGGSVEDVDQSSDKLEPAECNADDPLIAEEFCNDCFSQEDGLLERVEVPVEAAVR